VGVRRKGGCQGEEEWVGNELCKWLHVPAAASFSSHLADAPDRPSALLHERPERAAPARAQIRDRDGRVVEQQRGGAARAVEAHVFYPAALLGRHAAHELARGGVPEADAAVG
jgi:hypothetical protein